MVNLRAYWLKREQSQQLGFTIFELLMVIIVLGAMIFIVFLAVPAAQRNSRNNGIKSDATAIRSAVRTFISNNDGDWPSPTVQTGPALTIAGHSGTSPNDVNISSDVHLSLIDYSSGGGSCPTFPDPLQITVSLGCACNAAGDANVLSAKKISLTFSIELAGTNRSVKCIEV